MQRDYMVWVDYSTAILTKASGQQVLLSGGMTNTIATPIVSGSYVPTLVGQTLTFAPATVPPDTLYTEQLIKTDKISSDTTDSFPIGHAIETTIYGDNPEIVTRDLGLVTEIYYPNESGQGYNVTDLMGNTITPTPVSTPKTSSNFLKLALIGLVGIALLKGRL